MLWDRLFKKVFKIFALLVLIYVLPVGGLYLISETTDLPGRRAGPKDAFRHTYASAVIGRYISPRAVDIFTRLTGRKAESSYDQMDVHNNTLGGQIGVAFSRGELTGSMYEVVLERVKAAEVNAQSPEVVRVLPQDKWNEMFCASCNW
jgi:hypothetical protein